MPALITTAASLYAANEARRDANNNASRQEAMARENLDFQKRMWQEEHDFNQPIKELLRSQLMTPGALHWGETKGQIEQNYNNLDAATTGKMYGTGMQGTGLDAAITNTNLLNKGRDLSKAWLAGVMNKDQLATALLNHDKLPYYGQGVGKAYDALGSMYGSRSIGDQNRYGRALAGVGQGIYSAAREGMKLWGSDKGDGVARDGDGNVVNDPIDLNPDGSPAGDPWISESETNLNEIPGSWW